MPLKAAQSWQPVPDEFTIDDIGARLLANLARGIYNHEAVLREYVQNACDAYNALPAIPADAVIKISVEDENTIAIHDNGIGMDLEGVRAYKKIAVSPKPELDGMTGFRGIGIWAGFQACAQLELTTTKTGDPCRYKMQIDFEEILKHVDENVNIKKLLDGRFRIQHGAADVADHYTYVRLIGLQQDYRKLTDLAELKRIVGQLLPCKMDPQFKYYNEISELLNSINSYQDFSILVENDEITSEVFKTFPENLEKPQILPLRIEGEDFGRVWYCTGDRAIKERGNEFRKFQLRIKNFAVGRFGIYDDENGSSFGLIDSTLRSAAALNWHVGEIHITDPLIVPDTPRSALELDSRARRAVAAIRNFYRERIVESRALAEFKKYRNMLDECSQAQTENQVPSQEQVTKWLESLAEQEDLVHGRSQDAVKKKLREYLTVRTTKSKRQNLSNWLRGVTPGMPSQQESVEPPTDSDTPGRSEQSNQLSETSRAVAQANNADGSVSAKAVSNSNHFDYEQLLSDIIAVIEAKIGPEDALYSPICKAIEDVFRKAGLTG